jgi:F420-dependent oxidoreductase-like protein
LVKFGLMLRRRWKPERSETSPSREFELILQMAEEAEKLGFYSVFMDDHLHTWGNMDSCFECYTSLAAIAMRTSKLRFGPLVTGAGYRNPAILAKMTSTLDVMSNGRLEFGIGAGWYEEEHRSYGYRFKRLTQRTQQLRETVQIIKKMWTEEKPTFHGRHFSIDGPINSPKPIQKPHPPIMIGGAHEKLTLRVVAELADRSNFETPPTIEDCLRKFKLIDKYCEDFGRGANSVERTLYRDVCVEEDTKAAKSRALLFKPADMSAEAFLAPKIVGNPDECVHQFNKYVEQVGVRYIILRTLVPDTAKLVPDIDQVRLLARDVLPRVTD